VDVDERIEAGTCDCRQGPITRLAYDPADPFFLDDPYPYYRWLRDVEPVHRHAASGAYLLSRFEDVWEATSNWEAFSSESPVTASKHFASMDPPEHDRLRAAAAPFLAPGRVARLEPEVRALCEELLRPLEAVPRFDLIGEFAAVFPSRVVQRVVGVPGAALGEDMRRRALGIATAPDSQSMAAIMEELEELSRQVVRGGLEPETPGLIQQLRAQPRESRLADEQLVGICTNLVLAGTDTVANLIGNGIALLERHPDQRRRLAREPGLLPSAIEEMLRFESPAQSLGRRTRTPVRLHGVEIPAGAEVRLMWGAANRDEREFERPEVFDSSRSIRRHLAFGHGIHFCVGAALARLEARVAFEEILARWPEFVVDATGLVRLPSFWVRGYEHLPLVVG
jgi:hypothetical protein